MFILIYSIILNINNIGINLLNLIILFIGSKIIYSYKFKFLFKTFTFKNS